MNCSVCGRTIEQDFNYCPNCGSPAGRKDDLRQVIDETFTALEEIVRGDTIMRIENLFNRLNTIEEELDIFLLSESRTI